MKTTLLDYARSWVLALCVLLPVQRGAAQFIHITAELETVAWRADAEAPPSVKATTWTAQCVVGTDSWLITTKRLYGDRTFWFTGSNMFDSFVTTKPVSDRKELYERSHGPIPPIGQRTTWSVESVDGNPGRPVRVRDLLDYPGQICWLAFCSGPVLKRNGRQISPVYDLWKEFIVAPSGFPDRTTVFEDDLGLPSSVTLYTSKQQPVLQYRATFSTNILGWNFPLEFYLAQYNPAGTNGWAVCLTAKARVTSIAPGGEPQLPREIQMKVLK